VLNVIVVGILIMPLSLPILPVAKMEGYCKQSARFIGDWPVRWEDGESHRIPQDYADQTGWKQLAGLVAAAYNKLDRDEQKHCIIYAKDYGQAGALQYYGKQQGLPDPICFSDAFLFWAPDSVNSSTMIMVAREPGKLDSLYNNWSEVATVDDKYFRENGLNVYMCKNPKPYWKEYYQGNVKELKDEFNAGR